MARSKTGDDHVAVLVDRLLAGSKQPVGDVAWREGSGGEMKIRWPLLYESEVSDAELHLTALPNRAELKFTIALVYRWCIARLDFVPDREGHTNPADRAVLLDGTHRVRGPHCHSWADNRHLATAAGLPHDLKCARPLPTSIRRWEQAFRWFCGEVNIDLSGIAIPAYPQRTRLL